MSREYYYKLEGDPEGTSRLSVKRPKPGEIIEGKRVVWVGNRGCHSRTSAQPWWDIFDREGNLMGTQFTGLTVAEARAGFLHSIHPDHRPATYKKIGRIERVDFDD